MGLSHRRRRAVMMRPYKRYPDLRELVKMLGKGCIKALYDSRLGVLRDSGTRAVLKWGNAMGVLPR